MQELLDEKNIIRKTKDPADANALGVVDRAIQTIKTKLAESLSEEPGEWASRIKEVVSAYNSTPHATVHGEPEEVKNNPVQSFLVLQDNAGKLKANQTLLESRKKQLDEAGAFRRPLKGLNAFRRGFKAAYGEVEKVKAVSGSNGGCRAMAWWTFHARLAKEGQARRRHAGPDDVFGGRGGALSGGRLALPEK